ncbi:MAG: hypothetical protein WD042_19445 [Phycisphaeraceae bacterium]
MATQTIEIHVDPTAAEAFAQASPQDQRKIELLLNLRLMELVQGPRKPLAQVMNEIGAKARARGMTPEALAELLRD